LVSLYNLTDITVGISVFIELFPDPVIPLNGH